MSDQHREDLDSVLEPTPRRTVVRSLVGAVVGVVTLGVLAACGGDGDDEDNGDDEDEDD